jgi:death-on-curing protein
VDLSAEAGRIQRAIARLLDELYHSESDTEATVRTVRLLAAAACYYNIRVVADFGGRAGPNRGIELIEQVVGAAFQSYEGEPLYQSEFERAAVLLRGIVQGHPFMDGNKRTGFWLAAYYLHLEGHVIPTRFDVDEVEAFCLQVSAGLIREVSEIATTLRTLWTAPDPN